jgi:hypothetical protein
VFPLEGLCNVPVSPFFHLARRNCYTDRAAFADRVDSLAGPIPKLLCVLGMVAYIGERGENIKGGVMGETGVDCAAEMPGYHGSRLREARVKLGDCAVYEFEALICGECVVELELGEASGEVREGGTMDEVCCYAVVTVSRLSVGLII